MTSAVAISRRHHPPSPKGLSAEDRKRITAICADPRLADKVKRLRLDIAITPDRIASRDLLKTMAVLAEKLQAAGDALATLPEPARAFLQEKLGGTQAQQHDLAMTLYNVAGCAGAAMLGLRTKSGRPQPSERVVYAVMSARSLCKSFHLELGNVPELASIILGSELSTDVCKGAAKVWKPT